MTGSQISKTVTKYDSKGLFQIAYGTVLHTGEQMYTGQFCIRDGISHGAASHTGGVTPQGQITYGNDWDTKIVYERDGLTSEFNGRGDNL